MVIRTTIRVMVTMAVMFAPGLAAESPYDADVGEQPLQGFESLLDVSAAEPLLSRLTLALDPGRRVRPLGSLEQDASRRRTASRIDERLAQA